MKRTGRQILSLMMTILLLAATCTAAFAEAAPAEGAAAAAPGADAQLPAAEDSGIIDAAALQQWMDNFAQEHNLKQDYMRFSVGFWYSGTGDSWYYDADQWMYSASLYKVPVSMLMAEKEAAGELTLESVVNGTTLEYLESTALVYSNNDSGHSMVSWLGGTYAGKCSDMTIKFTDLPDSYFDQDFYDVSYYTARYMTQVMRTLYQGGDAKFPHVLDYLKQAQPDDYYNRNAALKGSYTIAQKFGAYEEGNGNNNNHCAAVGGIRPGARSEAGELEAGAGGTGRGGACGRGACCSTAGGGKRHGRSHSPGDAERRVRRACAGGNEHRGYARFGGAGTGRRSGERDKRRGAQENPRRSADSCGGSGCGGDRCGAASCRCAAARGGRTRRG